MSTNATVIKYLSQLCSILKVPAGKISLNKDLLPVRIKNNKSTTGFINIVLAVVKESNLPLSGRTPEDKAEIFQWLEYVVLYTVDTENAQNVNDLLKELNSILLTKTYLVSDVLTVADLALYCALQSVMVKLSYLEKEKYINVSRWFDNIQQFDNVKSSSKPVDFKTVYLLSVAPCKH